MKSVYDKYIEAFKEIGLELTYKVIGDEEYLQHPNNQYYDLEDVMYYYAPDCYIGRELHICTCVKNNRFEFSLDTKCMGFPKKSFKIRNEDIRAMIIQLYKKEIDQDILLDYLKEYSLEFRMYCQCYDYLQGVTIIS